MSTNIRVDVTLQRLQQQLLQSIEQNRNDRQQREGGLLQSAQAQPGQTTFNPSSTTGNTKGARTQSPFDPRNPAAQRLQQGSTMGVEYTTTVIFGVPRPTFRLTVGPPGLLQSVQAETLGPSGTAATNRPPTTDESSGPASVLGFLILYDPPNAFGNNWVTEYPCGTFSNQGPGTAPTTSWSEFSTANVVTQDFDDSAYYLLPIGNQTCIFVYVYSTLRTLTVYKRRSRTDRVSVNPRFTTAGCGLQTGTYYDRESTFLTEDIFDNIEERQAYQVMAFVVGPDSVRTLQVPDGLEAAMRELHPPMEVNSTAEVLTSAVYTRYEFADVAGAVDPPNYNGPITYGYSTVPAFSLSLHRQNSLHGDYRSVSARNDVLAKQFGIGYLNQSTHDGDFFTPAVFRFITAAMNLSTTNAQLYDYMRSTYFSRAPRRYLAPCVFESSCTEQQVVGFDQTTTAPVDINTPVPEADFTRKANYDVALNGSYDYEVVFGWDWDNPSYCSQQLKALGFTSADLKP